MSRCPGLHCDGCGHGSGINAWIVAGGIVVAAAVEVLEWVAGHVWDLLAGTAVICILAAVVVVVLFRLGARRDQRHAAAHSLLIDRDPGAALPAAARREIPPVINLNIFTADAEASAAAIIRNASEGEPR
jgi:hypothetical protein